MRLLVDREEFGNFGVGNAWWWCKIWRWRERWHVWGHAHAAGPKGTSTYGKWKLLNMVSATCLYYEIGPLWIWCIFCPLSLNNWEYSQLFKQINSNVTLLNISVIFCWCFLCESTAGSLWSTFQKRHLSILTPLNIPPSYPCICRDWVRAGRRWAFSRPEIMAFWGEVNFPSKFAWIVQRTCKMQRYDCCPPTSLTCTTLPEQMKSVTLVTACWLVN